MNVSDCNKFVEVEHYDALLELFLQANPSQELINKLPAPVITYKAKHV